MAAAFINSTSPNNSALRHDRLTERLMAIESILAVYVMPVIIYVGTVGNLTSLAVLLRRRMRRTSVYLYLTVLAVADVSVLYVSAFKTWIRLVRVHSSVILQIYLVKLFGRNLYCLALYK